MNFKKITDIGIIVGLGLVPLIWFRDGYTAIAGFDFAVYLDPVAAVRKSLYLWSDMMAGGYDISHEISSLPYYLLFALPIFSGASFYTAEKVVFVSVFMLQGISMYYMIGAMFGKEPFGRKAALLGVFFYMFSYPVMAHFGRGNMMALLTYGLLPLVIGLLYKGFTRPEKGLRYIVLIALLSIPVSATKGHPADFVVLVAVSVFFTLFHIAFSPAEERARAALFALKAAGASVLVNLWWIAPNIFYLADFGLGREDLVSEGFYNLGIVNYYSEGVSLLNMFRNERLNLWFDVPKDILFNSEIYQTPIFIVTGVLLSAAAYAPLLKKGCDRKLVFFAILGLAAVFLGKGTKPPGGWIYSWMCVNIPGFFLFRAPSRIFSSLFLFSMVPPLAYGTARMVHGVRFEKAKVREWLAISRTNLQSLSRLFSASLLGACSILYAWPSLTGAHMKERGTLKEPGVFNNIPPGYFEAVKWVQAHNHGKLYYPYGVYDFNSRWGYNGPDPTFELLDAPKVVSRPNGTVYIRYQKPIEELNRVFRDFRYGDLGKVLGLYNIRYPVLHADASPWVLPDYNFNEYAQSLFEASGIGIKKKSAELIFFENEKSLPRIYQAGGGYILAGDESALPALGEAGLLDAPFLLMARDMDAEPESIENALATARGVVFHNSNPTDAMCDVFEKKYGYFLNGKEVLFETKNKAEYDVFIKGADAAAIEIDRGEAALGEGAGYRWRSAGTVWLDQGDHELSVKADRQVEVVLIPISESRTFMDILKKRMDSPGFDAVYLLEGGTSAEKVVTGTVDYTVSTLKPALYERMSASLFADQGGGDSGWRGHLIEGAGKYRIENGRVFISPQTMRFHFRLSRKFEPVDLGYYPELNYDGPFRRKGGVIEATLAMIVGLEHGKMEVRRISTDDLAQGNYLNVKDYLRDSFGESAVHELRTLIIDIVVNGENTGEEVSFDLPDFRGYRGVIKKECAGGAVETREKAGTTGVENEIPCGRWTEGEAFEPDAYLRSHGPEAGYTVTMIRKNEMANEPPSGKLEFTRLSPVRYVVRAAIPQPPSFLVFSDSYNGSWSLYANGKRYKPVKVNGFANGFRIDEAGWQELTLEYRPQRVLEYSAAFSGVTLAGLLAAGAASSGKGRKK